MYNIQKTIDKYNKYSMDLKLLVLIVGAPFFLLLIIITTIYVHSISTTIENTHRDPTEIEKRINDIKNMKNSEFIDCSSFQSDNSQKIQQFLKTEVKDHLNNIFNIYGKVEFFEYSKSDEISYVNSGTMCKPIELYCQDEFENINMTSSEKLQEYDLEIFPYDVVCDSFDCLISVINPPIPFQILQSCFSDNNKYYAIYDMDKRMKMLNRGVYGLDTNLIKVKFLGENYKNGVIDSLYSLANDFLVQKNEKNKTNFNFFTSQSKAKKKKIKTYKSSGDSDMDLVKLGEENKMSILSSVPKFLWDQKELDEIYYELYIYYFNVCTLTSSNLKKNDYFRESKYLCCNTTSNALAHQQLNLKNDELIHANPKFFDHCNTAISVNRAKKCMDSFLKSDGKQNYTLNEINKAINFDVMVLEKREINRTAEFHDSSFQTNLQDKYGKFFLCENNVDEKDY
ncbi:hypothetical protein EDEG_02558 [Edhazardia aedis USNM 41457]|uniref:Uncharacterized protein n=1 Tax=Edhazardia aedis (strain USNM 41457) TaxID=1003232 RepID=J9D6E7_EDHAE|nr:hypothetical protein EDEG_02558 [Edhazardia aedis USNM 41457]|eukprot:EJW03079.1 hypothetical protein EDEG_02558 [Edhazardia aedis USNM 41457]